MTIIANMKGTNISTQAQIKRYFLQCWGFVGRFFRRCSDDQLVVVAGYLAFVSLLSVVPLISVTFAVLKAFPVFISFRENIELFIFSNFVPTSSEQIQGYINTFVANTSQMTAIGLALLLLVALSLISAIDRMINRIWRTEHRRKKVYSFAVYWMVLTLGPLLVGASLAATSYLVSIAAMAESYTPGIGDFFIKLLPFLLSTVAFMLLFAIVPNTLVNIRSAFIGAVVTATMFEVCKRVFVLYMTSFPSYQLIYGALAAIPILFMWVYVSWIVVLLGAELTYAIDQLFKQDDIGPITSNQQEI